MKRAFDVLAALFGILILFPFMLVIAAAIKLSDGGPVFFRQWRVGRDGRDFKIWKFRTMIVDAEAKGKAITVGHDSRITTVGRVLRSAKIDEWPQLLNVLKGEMSFVGPRPEVRKYVERYSKEQAAVLMLRPGITDMASFAFYDESELLAQAKDPEQFYLDVLVPEKIRLNLEYARTASVCTDFVLIVVTALRSFGYRAPVFKWMNITPPEVQP